jgi:hypothetical protein
MFSTISVSLGQLCASCGNVVLPTFIALCLLSELGEVNSVFVTHDENVFSTQKLVLLFAYVRIKFLDVLR